MKLKKILAGTMAFVMIAGSLLVSPVEANAAAKEETSKVAGYDWWNNSAYAKTEAVTVADGDTVVWTLDVKANIGGEGALYVIESTDTNGAVDFSSWWDAWGANVTEPTTTIETRNDGLIQAGNVYTATLTREGNLFKVVHKNVTTDTVVGTQTLKVTDCPASSTFYLYVQYGEMNYKITKNGTPVDSSALRGYGWWNGNAVAKSTPIALADGGKIVWTLDIHANIGGDGAIYVIESADSNGYVDFSSAGGAWGDGTSATTTTVTPDNFTLIQAGNVYTVTLTREGGVVKAVHKNETTGTVVLEQTATLTDAALASSTFYIYTQYGEIDCSYEVPAKSIAITGANNKVVAGSDLQLSADVFPANTTDEYTVTWSSSNGAVATVDNAGKVIGVAEGTVTITAKISDTIVDTYEVAVQALAIPITGIDVTADKTEIKVGTTATLTTTITPADTTDDKTVTYTSSDETIATVDATGKVTAVKPGTATITASVLNGTVKDTVTITVPSVAITDITLTADKTALEKGDIVNVVATINPADTTEDKTITWSSSNEKVATVDANGTVTAVGGGNATITAKAGNVTKDITFKVTAQETVVKKSTIKDFTVDGFLSVQSDGVQLKKGHTYTFTFNAKGTDAASTNLYEAPCYFIYTNTENKFNSTEAYKELIFTRGDVWCWFNGDIAVNPDALPQGATFTRTFPEDWATWTAAMKAGAECKLTVKYDGSTVTATYTVADASTVASFPVSIPSGSNLYLGLTGEKVALTNIQVADEYVTTISGKGDVNVVVPVVVLLLGGAVVLVASKKRFA